ncbi:CU044_5270 family protein [Streptomyces sp. MBT62]|uniref:CU044_5270 family protein n=1 Tax=Streptomyces sp. MBT62 TaxID=2800410 RepID=UPI00190D8462|nr:CU044_5270 family protein [Streptomyces sp. MBT62]MBK3566954.1 CU044_5270 family protein [Streptomyces sp. MBT62]
MNTDPQELAELLPAPGRPVLSRDRHRVLREHLMQHITHEHDTVREQSATTGTAPGRPARRRLVLVAAPLALAAAVGLGVVAVDNARDGKDGTAAADGHQKAVQLLDRIALAAASRPTVTARDDQFIYTKSQGSAAELGVDFSSAAELAGHKGLFTPKPYNGAVRQEQWDAVDGKADGLRKGVAVADPTQKMSMDMKGAGYLTFRQLQALPTDPDALLKKFAGDASDVSAARRTEVVVENLGAVVDEATLLPDLSAGIYRAMAKLPGVSVVDHVKDAAGREGVGLTFKNAPKGYAWVFDSSSLVYRGTTDAALLGVGVTDQAGEVPAG